MLDQMPQAIRRAIALEPADDAPRLIAADWLDEQGEPETARFIRLQCAVAAFDPKGGDPADLAEWRRESKALFRANVERWLGPLHAAYVRESSSVVFRRGLVHAVQSRERWDAPLVRGLAFAPAVEVVAVSGTAGVPWDDLECLVELPALRSARPGPVTGTASGAFAERLGALPALEELAFESPVGSSGPPERVMRAARLRRLDALPAVERGPAARRLLGRAASPLAGGVAVDIAHAPSPNDRAHRLELAARLPDLVALNAASPFLDEPADLPGGSMPSPPQLAAGRPPSGALSRLSGGGTRAARLEPSPGRAEWSALREWLSRQDQLRCLERTGLPDWHGAPGGPPALPSLRALRIVAPDGPREWPDALGAMPALRELSIVGHGLDADCFEHMCRRAAAHPSLEKVSLWDNRAFVDRDAPGRPRVLRPADGELTAWRLRQLAPFEISGRLRLRLPRHLGSPAEQSDSRVVWREWDDALDAELPHAMAPAVLTLTLDPEPRPAAKSSATGRQTGEWLEREQTARGPAGTFRLSLRVGIGRLLPWGDW